LENNSNFKSVISTAPCLSHHELNLYFTKGKMSFLDEKNFFSSELTKNLNQDQIAIINKNPKNCYELMNLTFQMADGSYDILDLSEKCNLPFRFVFNYLNLVKKKKLIKFL